MPRNSIEEKLEQRAGIHAVAEEDETSITLSGQIQSENERQTALEIVTAMAPSKEIVDNLEVEGILPSEIGGIQVSDSPIQNVPGATPDIEDDEWLEPGDFTEQEIAQDAFTASGPSGHAGDEEVSEGEEAYVPPIDPPTDRQGEFVGGFAVSSMDSEAVAPSDEDRRLGDEAIAEAIRRELREDAATSSLDIEVEVDQGIVTLRGKVPDIADAESAEEVATRLPGVREVREELDVTSV